MDIFNHQEELEDSHQKWIGLILSPMPVLLMKGLWRTQNCKKNTLIAGNQASESKTTWVVCSVRMFGPDKNEHKV